MRLIAARCSTAELSPPVGGSLTARPRSPGAGLQACFLAAATVNQHSKLVRRPSWATVAQRLVLLVLQGDFVQGRSCSVLESPLTAPAGDFLSPHAPTDDGDRSLRYASGDPARARNTPRTPRCYHMLRVKA
jgi:hypothetical protein